VKIRDLIVPVLAAPLLFLAIAYSPSEVQGKGGGLGLCTSDRPRPAPGCRCGESLAACAARRDFREAELRRDREARESFERFERQAEAAKLRAVLAVCKDGDVDYFGCRQRVLDELQARELERP
jgi:hypothetical protein